MNHKKKIITILKQFNIPYWTEGKNVSIGWVNIQCPYCSDKSNHCGIDANTLKFNCWRCSETGMFSNLLQELTGLSRKECKDLVESKAEGFQKTAKDQINQILHPDKEETKETGTLLRLPDHAIDITQNTVFPLLDYWCENRDIDRSTLINHGCFICRVGSAMNRIIIPIYCDNILVAYKAADLTGQAQLRYDIKGSINNYLYNYDRIYCTMIVTEGILDAWRLGDEAVATFGTHITEMQKHLILKLKLKELIFCRDGDAWMRARKEAEFFYPFIEKVFVIRFPKDEDPDSFGKEKTYELIEKARNDII